MVELEQRLALGKRQRQQLAQARADPRGRVEPVRLGQQPRLLLDHALEQAHTSRTTFRYGGIGFTLQSFNTGELQAIALDTTLDDAATRLERVNSLLRASARAEP